MLIPAVLAIVSLVIAGCLAVILFKYRWNWTHRLLYGISLITLLLSATKLLEIRPPPPKPPASPARAEVQKAVDQARLDLEAFGQVAATYRREPSLVADAQALEKQLVETRRFIAEGEKFLRQTDASQAPPEP